MSFSDWKVDRISRGVYAASGSFELNYDIVEGDDNEVYLMVMYIKANVRILIVIHCRLK